MCQLINNPAPAVIATPTAGWSGQRNSVIKMFYPWLERKAFLSASKAAIKLLLAKELQTWGWRFRRPDGVCQTLLRALRKVLPGNLIFRLVQWETERADIKLRTPGPSSVHGQQPRMAKSENHGCCRAGKAKSRPVSHVFPRSLATSTCFKMHGASGGKEMRTKMS